MMLGLGYYLVVVGIGLLLLGMAVIASHAETLKSRHTILGRYCILLSSILMPLVMATSGVIIILKST